MKGQGGTDLLAGVMVNRPFVHRGRKIAFRADPLPESGEILIDRMEPDPHHLGLVAQEMCDVGGDGINHVFGKL